jgi:hypothetical protein
VSAVATLEPYVLRNDRRDVKGFVVVNDVDREITIGFAMVNEIADFVWTRGCICLLDLCSMLLRSLKNVLSSLNCQPDLGRHRGVKL